MRRHSGFAGAAATGAAAASSDAKIASPDELAALLAVFEESAGTVAEWEVDEVLQRAREHGCWLHREQQDALEEPLRCTHNIVYKEDMGKFYKV